MHALPLAPGSSLGPYRIVDVLGVGGMGEVYRAHDARLARDVAVKVLPAAMAGDPERLERFEREARTIASLSHPNIVTIHSVEQADGMRFITMELVEGDTLASLIPPGGLPLSRFFELALPIVSAVSAAHERSVAHRDLKPENVMVGGDGRVRVLDFGLATSGAVGRASDDDATRAALTGMGQVFGTVPYMSPEQVKGLASDTRSDVFSLGVMLFEMATGERPFGGETSADVMSAILRDRPPSVTEIKADLPRDLATLLRRCLEKLPVRRFASAHEVASSLEELKRELDAGGAKTSRASTAPLARGQMAAVWSHLGEPEKALELRQADLRRTGRHDAAVAVGRVFAEGGEEAVYRWYLRTMEKRAESKRVSPYNRAVLLGVLGEVDEAFHSLDRACDERWGLLIYFKVNPWLRSLHPDPRWGELLRRMNVA